MVASKILRIRLKPETETAMRDIKKFAGFADISKTVRHLIECGLSFYQHREQKIKEIKADISQFTITPAELYDGIKIKRKYLGR